MYPTNLTKFSGLVDICVGLQTIDLTFIFRSLKRRCYGNQFWGQIGEFAYPIFIRRTGILKRIGASQRRFEEIKWR